MTNDHDSDFEDIDLDGPASEEDVYLEKIKSNYNQVLKNMLKYCDELSTTLEKSDPKLEIHKNYQANIKDIKKFALSNINIYANDNQSSIFSTIETDKVKKIIEHATTLIDIESSLNKGAASKKNDNHSKSLATILFDSIRKFINLLMGIKNTSTNKNETSNENTKVESRNKLLFSAREASTNNDSEINSKLDNLENKISSLKI